MLVLAVVRLLGFAGTVIGAVQRVRHPHRHPRARFLSLGQDDRSTGEAELDSEQRNPLQLAFGNHLSFSWSPESSGAA